MRLPPLQYNLRSLAVRRQGTVLTLVAIALSTAVLVLVLSLAVGFEEALGRTGRPDNVLVMRRGAQSEGVSVLDRDRVRTILSMPHPARGPDGHPVAAAELYAAFSLARGGGGNTNIPIRGVSPASFAVRSDVRIARGRAFARGSTEVLVGRNLLGRVEGCRLGGAIRIAGLDWAVVGVLDGGGGAHDSEIWGDVETLVDVFDRRGFNIVVARLPSAADVEAFRRTLEADRHLNVQVLAEPDYYAAQAGALGTLIRAVAWFLAIVMSAGSVFGAANTLLASVAARTREIGTLLAMGFRPAAIFLGFLFEAALLGLAGGALGVLLAMPVHGLATGTTNWTTFTEQAFAFRVTPQVALAGLALALAIGLLGGALPALRASRLHPVEAFRA